MDDFKQQLTGILKRYGWDHNINMPDFILAEMVEKFLVAMMQADYAHEQWAKSENEGESPQEIFEGTRRALARLTISEGQEET